VEHALDAVHGAAHRAPIGDVPGGPLEFDPLKQPQIRAPPGENPQLVPAVRQRADEVRADKPTGPGDKSRSHRMDRIRG
jgi:hypothetical protein